MKHSFFKDLVTIRNTALVVVFVGSWLSVAGWYGARQHQIKIPAPGIKNLVTQGDIAGSMAQSRALLSELRAHNWDAKMIDPALLRLPDQSYALSEMMRGPETPSFTCKYIPAIYEGVAFYSTLYMRIDLEIVAGREAKSHGSGFFIVGWKNGEVTQVPLAQIRLLPKKERNAAYYVWPGVKGYSETLRPIADVFN